MNITLIAVITDMALMLASVAVFMAIVGRSSEERTETHTVEFYHGCQWSTWQTPLQDRIATIAGVTGFIAAIPGAALVMLLPTMLD